MTDDELIAEGERLARPCLILSEARPGEPVIGLWGVRDDTDREGPLLWIRVDCTWLRRRGFALEGYLSVYADAERHDFTVVHTPHGRLPAREGTAIPLSGREGRSLPQEEAILALGEAATGRREAVSGEAIRRYRGLQLGTAFAGWATLGGWRMS